MGRIVGAFCMSHVMFPPDGVEAQAAIVLKGMMEVRRRLQALQPDVLVFAGTDHFNNFTLALQVPLAVVVADETRTLGDNGVPVMDITGNREFAEGLARFTASCGMDIAQAEEMKPDHGMAFPKLVVDPANLFPTVLLYVNSGMPLPPSAARCHRLGTLVRDYVEMERDENERVVVMGLGGLSHWLRMPGQGRVATDFDQAFLEALENGAGKEFAARHSCSEILEASGNGGLEIASWLVAAGAAGDHGGQRVFYEPMEKWITGMAAIDLKTDHEGM